MKLIKFWLFTFVVVGLVCVPDGRSQDARARSELKTRITGLHAPDQCPDIVKESTVFLELYDGQEGANEVRLKLLECEQDWDLIREKLHELIRKAGSDRVAEQASIQLLRYLVMKGESEPILDIAKNFGLSFPASSLLPEVHYYEGTALLETANFQAANQKFLMLVLRFPESSYAGLGQLGIAESYYQAGNFTDALAQYKLAAKKISDKYYAPRIDLKIADCYQRLGDQHRSVQHYQKVVDEFPDTPEGSLAKTRLSSLKTQPRDAAQQTPRQQPTPKLEGWDGISVEGPVTIAKSESQTPTGANRYTVQVGAFKNRQNAVDLHGALKIKGYDAYFTYNEQQTNPIYKIRVGRCISKSEAAGIVEKLLKEEQLYSYATLCSSDQIAAQ